MQKTIHVSRYMYIVSIFKMSLCKNLHGSVNINRLNSSLSITISLVGLSIFRVVTVVQLLPFTHEIGYIHPDRHHLIGVRMDVHGERELNIARLVVLYSGRVN